MTATARPSPGAFAGGAALQRLGAVGPLSVQTEVDAVVLAAGREDTGVDVVAPRFGKVDRVAHLRPGTGLRPEAGRRPERVAVLDPDIGQELEILAARGAVGVVRIGIVLLRRRARIGQHPALVTRGSVLGLDDERDVVRSSLRLHRVRRRRQRERHERERDGHRRRGGDPGRHLSALHIRLTHRLLRWHCRGGVPRGVGNRYRQRRGGMKRGAPVRRPRSVSERNPDDARSTPRHRSTGTDGALAAFSTVRPARMPNSSHGSDRPRHCPIARDLEDDADARAHPPGRLRRRRSRCRPRSRRRPGRRAPSGRCRSARRRARRS